MIKDVRSRTFAQSRSHLKVIQSQVCTLEFGILKFLEKFFPQKLSKFSKILSKFYANGNSNHEYTKLRVHCTSKLHENCTICTLIITRVIKNFEKPVMALQWTFLKHSTLKPKSYGFTVSFHSFAFLFFLVFVLEKKWKVWKIVVF